MYRLLLVIVLAMSPISELRGAIPTALGFGFEPVFVYLLTVVFNALVFFPIFFGLKYVYSFFDRFSLFRKWVRRAREKGHEPLEKYGFLVLIPFFAIPLPITGAWTATLIAWLFDVDWWKAFIAIAIGVCIAGSIVMLGSLGVISFLWW